MITIELIPTDALTRGLLAEVLGVMLLGDLGSGGNAGGDDQEPSLAARFGSKAGRPGPQAGCAEDSGLIRITPERKDDELRS